VVYEFFLLFQPTLDYGFTERLCPISAETVISTQLYHVPFAARVFPDGNPVDFRHIESTFLGPCPQDTLFGIMQTGFILKIFF